MAEHDIAIPHTLAELRVQGFRSRGSVQRSDLYNIGLYEAALRQQIREGATTEDLIFALHRATRLPTLLQKDGRAVYYFEGNQDLTSDPKVPTLVNPTVRIEERIQSSGKTFTMDNPIVVTAALDNTPGLRLSCPFLNEQNEIDSWLSLFQPPLGKGVTRFDTQSLLGITVAYSHLVQSERPSSRQRQINRLAYQLLTGSTESETALKKAVRQLGIDLTGPFTVTAIGLKDPLNDFQAYQLSHPSRSLLWNELVTEQGDNILGIIMNPKSKAALAEVQQKNMMENYPRGIGKTAQGIEMIQRGWYEACVALGLGQELGLAPAYQFGPEQFGSYELLAEISPNILLGHYQELLKPLIEYRNGESPSEFLKTLEIYLKTLSIIKTAETLNMHRNGVLYRVERMKELFGEDLSDHEVAAKYRMAFMAQKTASIVEFARKAAGMQ